MSSELVKKLEDREQTLRENLFYESAEEYDQGYIRGFFEAMGIVEKYETQQMKEPFYQLDEEQKRYFSSLMRLADNFELEEETDKGIRVKAVLFKVVSDSFKNKVPIDLVVLNAITLWAIEQEKLGEEK